ncbi:TRAP transporter small permease [Mesorhizobium yinganensis]|uniref:TRAP transporter small permease n=1 Tax=Mesorhizobium yinganensis TaxID=3157707 RepID=UPI0032B84724
METAGATQVEAPATGWMGRWNRSVEQVSAVLFAVMFAGFLIQIISRYVLNMPVAWSLELCSIGYVWVVFFSAGMLVSERRQIVFDLIYHAIPPRKRRVLAIVNTVTMGLIFLAALPGVLDYVIFLGRRSSMLLKIRMDLVYSCFVIFMLAVIIGSAIRVWRLAGRRWEENL